MVVGVKRVRCFKGVLLVAGSGRVVDGDGLDEGDARVVGVGRVVGVDDANVASIVHLAEAVGDSVTAVGDSVTCLSL